MTTLKIDELMLECKRQGIKITQKDLAEAAGIGQTAIHKIIRGDTQAPKPQILVAIADYFTEALARKITVDDLIVKDDLTASGGGNLPKSVRSYQLDAGKRRGTGDRWALHLCPHLGKYPPRRLRSGRSRGHAWTMNMCTSASLAGDDSSSAPEAMPWHPSSSTAIYSSSSRDPSGSTKPSSPIYMDRTRCVQAAPPLRPQHGTRLSQPKLRPNHRHRGDE